MRQTGVPAVEDVVAGGLVVETEGELDGREVVTVDMGRGRGGMVDGTTLVLVDEDGSESYVV